MSLREAGRRLGIGANTIHGVAIGLGIDLARASQALVMTEDDFQRIKDHLEQNPPRRGRGRPKKVATAT